MNKDIIYIESNDDITDLIAKVKNSAGKLIVLIPPKGVGILHSSVNIKLIAKIVREAKKSLVIVTTDTALTKFAAGASIPIASDLKSRPAIPSLNEDVSRETIAEEFTSEPESASKLFDESGPEKTDDSEVKTKKSEESKIPDFKKYRKWFIIGGIGLVAIVVFLIWALVIAPSIKVDLTVITKNGDFSSNVNFVTDAKDEDVEAGKFYLTEEKYESESKVEFEATGERDDGGKASGSIKVTAYLNVGGKLEIPAGATFTYDGLVYSAAKAASLVYDESKCENSGDISSLITKGCKLSTTVNVSANAAGTKYNIAAHDSGWISSLKGVTIINESAFSGGSTKIVKFVSQSDVDKAKENLSTTSESTGKSKLNDQISDSVIAIESSFKSTNDEIVSSPKVGEVVDENTKPTLTAKTTFSIYTVDIAQVKDFITKKAKINNDQRIYSLGNPFIEHFVETEGGYTAKLKTKYYYGASITENDVRDRIYGVKIGEARSNLNVDGVKVEISGWPFWVNSVPKNPNKVSVKIIDDSKSGE